MALVGKTEGYVTYQDVKNITDNPNESKERYLKFNGSNTYGVIPISIRNKMSWEMELTIVSNETRKGSQPYNQRCIIGVDTPGYRSYDAHADIKEGYFHIFSGLGGNTSIYDLPSGSELITSGGDYGFKTPKYISDGNKHTIKFYLSNSSKLGCLIDGEDFGYLNVVETLGYEASENIYIGASYTGERVYCQFDLYHLRITVDGVLQGEYDLKGANESTVPDISGNNHPITLHGTVVYGESGKTYIDPTLPEGMGGYSNPYVIHKLHNGLDMRKLEVYFTYKQDDKINIWEGTDNVPVMTGLTQSYITNRPHDGLDIRNLESYIRYRPHDGLDIRKLETYFLYKQEDKVDTFKIPYGIGGFTTIFILERIKGLVGYLNDMNVSKVQGIALGSNYFNLKDIQKFNMIPFFNNNTTDIEEGDTTG